ncbi:MAG: beta-lactamase family protein [Oscillospiraceae bacterium]|nr:beta-lactamase family protein [Oscillospiraceae bacterium]
MKQIIAKAAALLAAACMTALCCIPASADETADCLPSGKTWDSLATGINLRLGLDINGNQYASEENNMTVDGVIVSPESGSFYASYSMIIFEGDQTRYTVMEGYSDVKAKTPITAETVYDWGSISKTFVWVSAMQLWEQGKLDLDADIRSYLPEGFFHNLQYDDPITMKHLMNHQGGWGESTYDFSAKTPAQVRSLRDALQATEPKQVFRPGTVASYSNWGAALAGYVIECITGEEFYDYVHAHILEPLGMEHTSFAPDHSDNEWVKAQRETLCCYEVGSIISGVRALGTCDRYIELYPCGSAVGTIGDLAKYAQSLVDDSAPLFASPETQEILFSPSSFVAQSDIPSFYHGFAKIDFAVPVFGHDGGTLGCTAQMLFDRESKIGFVALTNQRGGMPPQWEDYALELFGEASLSDVGDLSSHRQKQISGYYLPNRSFQNGIWLYHTYFSAVNLDQEGTLHEIRDGAYRADVDGTILGLGTLDDGRKFIQIEVGSFTEARMYVPKMILFTGYILAALISVYLLCIKRRVKKAGKAQMLSGEAVISAGQLAKIVSFLSLIVVSGFMYFGVVRTAGVLFGILQMLCAAICTAALLTAVVRICRRNGGSILRSGMHIAGNAIAVAVIIGFEMYHFWGC